MTEPLRIAINAELAPGTQAGGVQSVVAGLLHALGELPGGEEYVVIAHPENRTWIEPHLGRNTRIVCRPQKTRSWRDGARKSIRHAWRKIADTSPRRWPELPLSRGFYEKLGCHAIHFPFQHFTVCALPSIFNPHDLLHLHFPAFFHPRDIAAREALYPAACRIAHTVVVSSQWTRDDLTRRYSLDAAKVQVIPWAPPTQACDPVADEAVAAARAKYQIEQPFAFYPAVTWEHKNHLRLLQAIAELRDHRGQRVQLVCTGHQFARHWVKVEAERRRLGLQDQVSFLGEIPFAELRALYRAAQFVIVPTLFEAASGPVFEAWQEGIPVACSTVTSLPEQAGAAALLFDPYSVAAIADALAQLSSSETLRVKLHEAGARRLRDFSWERTARAYRAVYRRAAGRPLDRDDAELLAWDWMRESRR